jgi:hypothetical protein
MLKTSKAKRFGDVFESQERDEKGFHSLSPAKVMAGLLGRLDLRPHQIPDFRELLEECAKNGTVVSFPLGEDSADPSWKLIFSDGSTCFVGNPNEACFAGFVTIGEDTIPDGMFAALSPDRPPAFCGL